MPYTSINPPWQIGYTLDLGNDGIGTKLHAYGSTGVTESGESSSDFWSSIPNDTSRVIHLLVIILKFRLDVGDKNGRHD